MQRSKMDTSKPLGVLPLGRATFDVPYAEAKLTAMRRALEATGAQLYGPDKLLTDAATTADAVAELNAKDVEQALVLQVTFTDAAATLKIAAAFAAPLAIWAVPEPRRGERLRLNALCGLNLASHALARSERQFSWLYAAPDDADIAAQLDALLGGRRLRVACAPEPVPAANGASAVSAASTLRGKRIARIGAHPDGFATCSYDAVALKEQTGGGGAGAGTR